MSNLSPAATRALAKYELTVEEVRGLIASRRKDPTSFEIVGVRLVKFSRNLDVTIRLASGTTIIVDCPVP